MEGGLEFIIRDKRKKVVTDVLSIDSMKKPSEFHSSLKELAFIQKEKSCTRETDKTSTKIIPSLQKKITRLQNL